MLHCLKTLFCKISFYSRTYNGFLNRVSYLVTENKNFEDIFVRREMAMVNVEQSLPM